MTPYEPPGITSATLPVPDNQECENCGTRLWTTAKYRGRELCLNCYYEEQALESLKKRGITGIQRQFRF
jgi:hypothetical protein